MVFHERRLFRLCQLESLLQLVYTTALKRYLCHASSLSNELAWKTCLECGPQRDVKALRIGLAVATLVEHQIGLHTTGQRDANTNYSKRNGEINLFIRQILLRALIVLFRVGYDVTIVILCCARCLNDLYGFCNI